MHDDEKDEGGGGGGGWVGGWVVGCGVWYVVCGVVVPLFVDTDVLLCKVGIQTRSQAGCLSHFALQPPCAP